MEHKIYSGGLDAEIIALFKQTFTDSEGQDEGNLIGTLVQRFLETTPKEDIHVFLTLDSHQVVAAVVFSRLTFDESTVNTWLLSPAAVATRLQGTGVGQGLIRFAHDYLKVEGVKQLVTYGDINFYSKVGYRPVTEEVIPSPHKLSYPESWIAQGLTDEGLIPIKGKAYCAEALNAPELW
jgi:predicted N-acetyltransferase YhbS